MTSLADILTDAAALVGDTADFCLIVATSVRQTSIEVTQSNLRDGSDIGHDPRCALVRVIAERLDDVTAGPNLRPYGSDAQVGHAGVYSALGVHHGQSVSVFTRLSYDEVQALADHAGVSA